MVVEGREGKIRRRYGKRRGMNGMEEKRTIRSEGEWLVEKGSVMEEKRIIRSEGEGLVEKGRDGKGGRWGGGE
jgi:hypothetical protein